MFFNHMLTEMKYQFIYLTTTLKSSIFKILGIVIAFLIPIQPLILTVGLMILLDTVFGIYRAKKFNQDITSRRLSQIISKMVLYQSSVILFFMMEKFILMDFIIIFTSIPLFLTKIITITLCSIELKSIDENYQAVSGKSIWKGFKQLVARTQEIKKDISNIAKKD